MTKPLKPGDVESRKKSVIPDCVVEAANELITRAWDGTSATVYLDELVALARINCGYGTREFRDGELDIEVMFRAEGWRVVLDRPGYNETYRANFVFTKKTTRR